MSNTDWDLGQKLIEKGACSLDQVREILSLQDRMRKMGAASKPFARVLLEKGYATRDQLLGAGVAERDLPPPVEEKAAARSQAGSRRSRGPQVFAVLALALAGIVCAIFVLRDPDEKVSSVPVSEEEADTLLQRELESITALGRKTSNYENAAEVVRRYEAFMKAQAGRKWEIEAQRRLKPYREGADLVAKAELEDLEKEAGVLREQQRWKELLAQYRKFPAAFLQVTESGRSVREKIQEISQRIAETYARDKADVEKLVQAKKYTDALARVKSMELSAPAERQEEVLGIRGRIERESRGAAEKARQEVADAYYKVDGPFKEAMARRDGFRAALVMREFISAPWSDEQRPFVKVRNVDYDVLFKLVEPWDPEKVEAICEAAVPETDSPDRLGTGEGALLALRNAASMALFMRDYLTVFHAAVASKERLDLPSLGKGHFEKRNERTVFIADDGAILEPETSPLVEEDFEALAMKVGPPNSAAHLRAGFFYFYSAPKMQKQAYDHLVRASLMGARGVKLYLGGLATAAESEQRRTLETKFGTAQDLFKNRQWPQAKKLLGEILGFADHSYVQSVRPDLEKMLYEIAEGSELERHLVVKYLAKKVEAAGADSIRVIYDFEGQEQLEAFEPVAEEGTRKFKGRWRMDRGAIESSSDTSILRWKTPVKGDVTLEYDLTPLEEAQNIVVNLCYNRGQANHYAVVLGFDWVGKTDGDRDNSAEDRFGIPRICVVKYPVLVDKTRWMNADTWEGWKTRLVGKAAGAWKPAKGKTARMRIERLGRSIRLLADRLLLWEGEDDEYVEGQIVFYSDCRCRVGNLAITFKP
jgi:hypothetical protein